MDEGSFNKENADPKPYLGPAQRRYGSLSDQAADFMDNYWPKWRDLKEPESYILPPAFAFKNPDISDEAIQAIQNQQQQLPAGSKSPESIKDRRSDDAEHIIYEAISQLKDYGIAAPFIAFQSLKVGEFKTKTRSFIPEVWKTLSDIEFGEHDFLVIGPSIGIIAIETKYPSYDNGFRKGDKALPKEFEKGVRQAQSVDNVLRLVETISGHPPPAAASVRKIFYVPNVTRRRYNEWMSSLTPSQQKQKEDWFKKKQVVPWFHDDAINIDIHDRKPPLYSKLNELFETPHPIDFLTYKKYSAVLAAVSSVFIREVIQGRYSDLEKANFSENIEALSCHRRIADQNPTGEVSPQQNRGSMLQRASRTAAQMSQEEGPKFKPAIMFYTPDQQSALLGPPRQFIVGPAGTGKTILLEIRALKILRRGQSLILVAPAKSRKRFEELFAFHGFDPEKYKVVGFDCFDEDQYRKVCDRFSNLSIDDIIQFIGSPKCRLREQFYEFFPYDNILIDDVFDWERINENLGFGRYFLVPLLLMLFAREKSANMRVWAAVDPASMGDGCKRFIKALLTAGNRYEEYFSVAILRQVMRCTENIFLAAYQQDPSMWHGVIGADPVMGHKIRGLSVSTARSVHFQTRVEAVQAVWNTLERILQLFSKDNIAFDHVAIIDGCGRLKDVLEHRLAQTLFQSFSEDGNILREQRPSSSSDQQLPQVLMVDHWYLVSSMEWPIVIYVSCLQIRQQRPYERYRAMSRATSKLFDISVTYEEEGEETICSMDWSSPPEDDEYHSSLYD